MGQYDADEDNVIQSIPRAVVSELTGVPSYWNNSVYVAGDLDYIKQFALVNGMLTQEPVSETAVVFGGAGPASTSITSNGNSNGILWAIRHTNPALFAFDPTNLANEFYDSTQALHTRDKLAPVVRFVTPTISNGKVYIGGTSTLTVFGLLPALSVGTGNNQTGVEKTVLPVPLSVLATDAYVSKPLAGVPVTCKDGGVGGVFSPSGTQTTDTSGTVTYTYTLPRKPLAVSITCTSTGYTNALFSETSAPRCGEDEHYLGQQANCSARYTVAASDRKGSGRERVWRSGSDRQLYRQWCGRKFRCHRSHHCGEWERPQRSTRLAQTRATSRLQCRRPESNR